MSRHRRPEVLVLVAGTGTEVGKTWVARALATDLRAGGVHVAARKPAQSFEPGDETAGVTDAQILAAATGDDPAAVTPAHRWYPVPLAPPMAAEALDRPPVRMADLLAELSWPEGTGVGLLEIAGGVRSPLAVDGDATVLAARTRPDIVVLVADAGLGTIGAVRSAGDALAGHRVLVLLNRFDPTDDLHLRNEAWLGQRDGLEVATGVAAVAGACRAVLERAAQR